MPKPRKKQRVFRVCGGPTRSFIFDNSSAACYSTSYFCIGGNTTGMMDPGSLTATQGTLAI